MYNPFHTPLRKDVHRVYHRFVKKFLNTRDEFVIKKSHKLMNAIETWAKHYPRDVYVVPCDDNFFASSTLTFIEHRALNGDYMGTTVLYIPQCTGEKPIQFFLYPRHQKELLTIIQKLGGITNDDNQ